MRKRLIITALRFRASGRTMKLFFSQESAGSMQLFMWHRDQKAASGCLSAIVNEAQDVNTDPSSSALLVEWM